MDEINLEEYKVDKTTKEWYLEMKSEIRTEIFDCKYLVPGLKSIYKHSLFKFYRVYIIGFNKKYERNITKKTIYDFSKHIIYIKKQYCSFTNYTYKIDNFESEKDVVYKMITCGWKNCEYNITEPLVAISSNFKKIENYEKGDDSFAYVCNLEKNLTKQILNHKSW